MRAFAYTEKETSKRPYQQVVNSKLALKSHGEAKEWQGGAWGEEGASKI